MKNNFSMLLLILPLFSLAQTDPPGLSAIKIEDLKTDLYAMADDHFRGREAGTLDELKVSVWWAEELRKAGLKPPSQPSLRRDSAHINDKSACRKPTQ